MLRYQNLTSKFYMLISYHMMNCYHYHNSHLKFENGCQALTSFSERYIMIGIMMGVLIRLNDLNLSICLLNSKALNSRMTYLKYGI